MCALVLYEVKHKDLCVGIRRHKFRQISHGLVVADKKKMLGNDERTCRETLKSSDDVLLDADQ